MKSFKKTTSKKKIESGFAHLDAVRGASEACDQAVVTYSAGANERINEEMRQIRKSRNTSWEKAASWYDNLLEESGSTYQKDIILPNQED